ncbi:hypothetical protein PVBG_04182 [Plasmodium vivax Brazil I]|uniref:Uncharacterized protein n=1 Tax=Plasmodium vivax (strain Brazil I) TaxID=1033975 RepID=A0A0J9VKP8_PLAV1|nr:hypothetical protein PVBG_04182 [Plasmodium vivax Brazil I]
MNKASSATYLEDCLLRGLAREDLQKVHAQLAEEEQREQRQHQQHQQYQQYQQYQQREQHPHQQLRGEEDEEEEEDEEGEAGEVDEADEEGEESGAPLNNAHRDSRNDFFGENPPTHGGSGNEYMLNYLNAYISKNIRHSKTPGNINQPNFLTSQSAGNMRSGDPTSMTLIESDQHDQHCMRNFLKGTDGTDKGGYPLHDGQVAANVRYMLIPNESERKEKVGWSEGKENGSLNGRKENGSPNGRISNFIHTELQNGCTDDRGYVSNRSSLMNGSSGSDQRVKNQHDWERAAAVLAEDVGNIFVNKFPPGGMGVITGGLRHQSGMHNAQKDFADVGMFGGEGGASRSFVSGDYVDGNYSLRDYTSGYHVNNPHVGSLQASGEASNLSGPVNPPPNNARECENYKLSPSGSENVSPSKKPSECHQPQGMFLNSIGGGGDKWGVPSLKEDPTILTDCEKANRPNRKAGEVPPVMTHSNQWVRGQQKENYRSFLYVINKRMEIFSKDRNVLAIEKMNKPGFPSERNPPLSRNNPVCGSNAAKGGPPLGGTKVNPEGREQDPIDDIAGASAVNANCHGGFLHSEPNESYLNGNVKGVQQERRQHMLQQCYEGNAAFGGRQGGTSGGHSRRGSFAGGGSHPNGLLHTHGGDISRGNTSQRIR